MDREVQLRVEDEAAGIVITADGNVLLRFQDDAVALELADELTIMAERRRRGLGVVV